MRVVATIARMIGASLLIGSAAVADTLEHQGIAREYLEYRPAGTKGKPLPLVLYLHGVRPPGWKNHTSAVLDALAEREGFVAVYPKAVKEHWNYSTASSVPPAMAGGEIADDVGFIERLVDRFVTSGAVDEKRVYVLGDSRGGQMVFSVMCRLADKIAAAGPLIAGMTDVQMADCKSSRAVPLMVVAGEQDENLPYIGWLYPKFGYRLTSAMETMEFWRVRHGCRGQKAAQLPHLEKGDPTKLWKLEWTGCARDGAVLFYGVEGGGHQIPSIANRVDAKWLKEAGAQNHDMETVEVFWDFARKFTR